MAGVIDQVIEVLRTGKPVKGTLELPDSIVFWDISYDGISIKAKATDSLGLDEPIPYSLPDDDPAPP